MQKGRYREKSRERESNNREMEGETMKGEKSIKKI